ncbi:putative RING zinc finger domain superfamily protein isoform X2 [Zea mays]|nr:putative RING zinc finger domain superfamily protein [Zea mays]XP_020397607.1 putative RING zinc finger domain superfamily protein isoform X2 [Zea mays]ACN27216.1 unknown [Zea mays]AQK90352.1 RING/U-box superfamily protein [Zea mays]AQK90353.1 RING/U-box superfamily protein [Zea mays]AQK90354.1 RING/U-box superfamily protein [Zea mays]AQK90355.1 RING/U-box superfamily protein [Zea mays]|eukprot:XP_008654743.1 putative RING zinc finger domain superfamily protein isoform X1 [Zea mays]
MARNNEGHLQLPEMDHIQPKNTPHNEPLPLGQKLMLHHGSDAPLRIGHSSHENMRLRSNDLPPLSHTVQTQGYRVGNPGASHAPFVHCHAGSSSSHLPEPAVNYPHRSEEGFAPVGSHMDNRRAATKRKDPIVHPAGISATGYYVGSSSNTQLSNSVQPNPAPLSEPLLRQIPLSIDRSGWDGLHLIHQEGFQRNVRARQRHSHNISLEPRTASTYPLNSVHVPSFGSTTSASLSMSVERNQASVSVPTRNVPSGAPGITSRSLTRRAYYPVVGSSNSSVDVVPTICGSSGAAIFANGGYALNADAGTVSIYPNPAPATSSGSITMPMPMLHQMVIQSHPPATSAATSTSMWIAQPLPARTAAASRHARRVSAGLANNGRYRRARSSYYSLHPLMMVEAERFMMDQLVFYESRAAAADPHRDMRLDIDNMSYEDLLALGESMGNVNTGLADEKISKCVKEVVCCSSDQMQTDQDDQDDDGSCVICLEGYRDKDMLGILKCRHDFHAGCIKKWLQTKNSCPVCKAAAA